LVDELIGQVVVKQNLINCGCCNMKGKSVKTLRIGVIYVGAAFQPRLSVLWY